MWLRSKGLQIWNYEGWLCDMMTGISAHFNRKIPSLILIIATKKIECTYKLITSFKARK